MERASLGRLLKPRRQGSAAALRQPGSLAEPLRLGELETSNSLCDILVCDVDRCAANDNAVLTPRDVFAPLLCDINCCDGTHRCGGTYSAEATYLATGSTDDGRSYTGDWPGVTTTELNATRTFAGATTTAFHCSGLRFPAVTLPINATVFQAHLRVTASNDNAGLPTLRIWGAAVDNAAVFAASTDTSTGNPGYRSRTNAYVDWAVGTWSNGAVYNSPDLSAVVQEIGDRSGWATGQAMAFIVTFASRALPASNAYRSILTWDYGSHIYGARLILQYFV